jgi:hypothetical protein
MKRIVWIVLAAALVGPGCLNLPFHAQQPAKPVAPTAPAPVPPPPAVMPDGITESNARSKADALNREIEFAQQKASAQ